MNGLQGLLCTVANVVSALGPAPTSTVEMVECLKLSLLPLLRRMCILRRALFRPSLLSNALPLSFADAVAELKLPGLHSLASVCSTAPGNGFIKSWLSRISIPSEEMIQSPSASITTPISALSDLVLAPMARLSLIPLPHNYSELFSKLSNTLCPSSGQPMTRASMCLGCGTVVCDACYACQHPEQGRQQGSCKRHLIE